MKSELKPFWARYFNFDWKFGLFMIVIICVPRFFLVLNANAAQDYRAIAITMLVSAICPFLFLSRKGLIQIGFTKPKGFGWLLTAFVLGLAFSFLLFVLGKFLYGNTDSNWYGYIGNSYSVPDNLSVQDKAIFFLIFAMTGMTFSPIGEELFFRGLVHSSFANSMGDKKATIVDSASFAITHLSHFGLVFIDGHWQFLAIPAMLWLAGMFLVSVLFSFTKRRSGSILGAVICHAAFNLGMIYCIFYLL